MAVSSPPSSVCAGQRAQASSAHHSRAGRPGPSSRSRSRSSHVHRPASTCSAGHRPISTRSEVPALSAPHCRGCVRSSLVVADQTSPTSDTSPSCSTSTASCSSRSTVRTVISAALRRRSDRRRDRPLCSAFGADRGIGELISGRPHGARRDAIERGVVVRRGRPLLAQHRAQRGPYPQVQHRQPTCPGHPARAEQATRDKLFRGWLAMRRRPHGMQEAIPRCLAVPTVASCHDARSYGLARTESRCRKPVFLLAWRLLTAFAAPSTAAASWAVTWRDGR